MTTRDDKLAYDAVMGRRSTFCAHCGWPVPHGEGVPVRMGSGKHAFTVTWCARCRKGRNDLIKE